MDDPDGRATQPPPAAPEFDRFETLTRKLVNVPKAEVDAAREADAQRPVSSE